MSFPVCKFFRSEQGCKFGNKCRYKHSDQFIPPVRNSGQQYQNDASVSGYSQPQKPTAVTERTTSITCQDEGLLSSRQQSNLPIASTSGDTSYNQYEVPVNSLDLGSLDKKFQGLTTTSDDATLSSCPSDTQRSSKICHYFARHGNCCFGNRCRFAHVRSHVSPPRFQQPAAENIFSADSEVQREKEEDGLRNPGIDRDQQGLRPHGAVSQGKKGYRASGGGQPCQSGGDRRTPARRNLNTRPDKVCQFFLQGRCYKGAKRCRFLHPRQKGHSETESIEGNQGGDAENDPTSQETAEDIEKTGNAETEQARGEKGGNGMHEGKSSESSDKGSSKRPPAARPEQRLRPPYVPQEIKKYRRDEIDDVEACRLRRNEIDQLVKRFPKNKVKVSRDCAEYFQCLVDFSPTDPDWPYDVKTFQLQIDIPSDYPLEMLNISLPAEQDLPETVRRYVEVSVEEWLEEKDRELRDKGQAELVFRTFLRWLDRNIEDVVTEGLRQLKRELVAKASGLEFVSARQLQKQYPQSINSRADQDEDDEEVDEEAEDEETESGEGDDEDDDDDDSSSDYYNEESGEDEEKQEAGGGRSREGGEKSNRKTRLERVKEMLAEPDRKGTEMSLKAMQLRESAATLYFDKVCLVVQCQRCCHTAEFTTSGGRVNVIQCGQCSQTQLCTFRPAMVHQFSPVLGYLDLDACTPFDLVLQNCSFVVACLNCSKETRPGVLAPGTPLDHWCRSCHQKLRVCADGVRFTQLEPSNTLSLSGAVKVVVPTRKRIPKDPAIQEGKPLPNFGTCKHYKKSYRWLRFPCCGKVYPCDVCHDAKEDHEMKFANRMICGFCCKEQVFAADRPCKSCDMNMTKVRTPHWEGGAGCRDKISMSRNDKAKHRNMAKTTSNHAKKVKDMQSKKKTKLRHS